MSRQLPPDVIDFLEKEIKMEEQQEGDVTASQVAEEIGISRDTSMKRLRQLVKEGKMQEYKGKLLNGKFGYFFRIV